MSPSDSEPEPRLENAAKPSEISLRGWAELFWAALRASATHQVPATAASATFYALLAFIPAVAAFGSIYGVGGSPEHLRDKLHAFADLVPSGVLDLVRDEAVRFARGPWPQLAARAAVFSSLAIGAASSSFSSLMTGLNVAFHEEEQRNWLHQRLLALAFALGVTAGLAAEIALQIRTSDLISARLVAWPVLLLGGRWAAMLAISIAALALFYRYGPDRRRARWRWVTPGSAMAALTGLVTSAVVSLYLAHFAQYERTYGGLGAVLGLMIWIWTAMIVVLAGAELNWAIECKTSVDTAARPRRRTVATAASRSR